MLLNDPVDWEITQAFQSTPPRGRATTVHAGSTQWMLGQMFQSTPPRGRPGLIICVPPSFEDGVSIHAPAWGGRATVGVRIMQAWDVSIHAPRVGGATGRIAYDHRGSHGGFKSTPPRGEGDCCRSLRSLKDAPRFSIHAPRVGGANLQGRPATGRSPSGFQSAFAWATDEELLR